MKNLILKEFCFIVLNPKIFSYFLLNVIYFPQFNEKTIIHHPSLPYFREKNIILKEGGIFKKIYTPHYVSISQANIDENFDKFKAQGVATFATLS